MNAQLSLLIMRARVDWFANN